MITNFATRAALLEEGYKARNTEDKRRFEDEHHSVVEWNNFNLDSLIIETPKRDGPFFACFRGACFAWLTRWRDGFIPPGKKTFPRAAALTQFLSQKKVNKEYVSTYYDYLTNRSPFRHAYADASRAIDGYMDYNTDYSANYVCGAMVSYRQAMEFPSFVPNFAKIRLAVDNEHLAFLMCHLLNVEDDGLVRPMTHKLNNHSLLPGWGSVPREALHRFLADDPSIVQDAKPFRQTQRYKGILNSWAGDDMKGRVDLLNLNDHANQVVTKDAFGFENRLYAFQSIEEATEVVTGLVL